MGQTTLQTCSRLALTIVACAAVVPASAHAEDVVTSDVLPARAVRVDAGLASPVGFLGAVYSQSVSAHTAVEVGAGFGIAGVAVSSMGKVRLGGESRAFTPGIGISLSLPTSNETVHAGHPNGDQDMHGPAVLMPWLDIDVVGIESRTSTGFVLAMSAGVTLPMRHAHWDVSETGRDLDRFSPIPQFRIGIGHTF